MATTIRERMLALLKRRERDHRNRPDLDTFPGHDPVATIGAPWRCPRCQAQRSVVVADSPTLIVASSSKPGEEAV